MQAEKTTHVRIYRKDARRIDAHLRKMGREMGVQGLGRPDFLRRLLDAYEAQRATVSAQVPANGTEGR